MEHGESKAHCHGLAVAEPYSHTEACPCKDWPHLTPFWVTMSD